MDQYMLEKIQGNFNQYSSVIKAVTTISVIFLFSCFLFRSIFLQPTTHLLDWNDYPYYVWTISQNVEHFRTLQFDGFFNTNSFYPHEGTLLFSDVLVPQSVIAFIWEILVTPYYIEPILIFNLTFFTNILLNIVSGYFVSKRFFSNTQSIFLATLTLSLSPFFFLQYGHLQMVSFWPGFFCLALYFKPEKNLFLNIWSGFFLALQFYASVYLTIFFLVIITASELFKYFYKMFFKQSKQFSAMTLAIIYITFFILAGPLIYKYKSVQNSYNIGINYSEYVYYSAHFTDYLFFLPYTLLSNFLSFWNKFNLHYGGEPVKNPSIILSILAVLGMFTIKIEKNFIALKTKKTFVDLYFLALTILGFIFSLGPRLNANGTFLHIPLPYHIFVKILPIFEPIRATNRWYFVFFIGVWYFALKHFDQKHFKYKYLVTLAVVLMYIFEVVPLSVQATSKNYYSEAYTLVEQECSKQNKVLLELPITPYKEGTGVIEYLQYRTGSLLASTKHRCSIVNGYSGLTPNEHILYDQQIFQAAKTANKAEFLSLLDQNQVELVKLNEDLLEDNYRIIYHDWLSDSETFNTLYEDNQTLVVSIK